MDLKQFCSRQIGTFNKSIVVSYFIYSITLYPQRCRVLMHLSPVQHGHRSLPSGSLVSPTKSFPWALASCSASSSLTSSSATVFHIQLSPVHYLLANRPIYHAHQIRSVAVSSSTSLLSSSATVSSIQHSPVQQRRRGPAVPQRSTPSSFPSISHLSHSQQSHLPRSPNPQHRRVLIHFSTVQQCHNVRYPALSRAVKSHICTYTVFATPFFMVHLINAMHTYVVYSVNKH